MRQCTRLKAKTMPELLQTWSRRLPHALLQALLPWSCALCGAGSRHALCAPCHARFLAPQRARCARCANPVEAVDAGLQCGACLAHQPAYDATLAACDYAAPLDRLVLQLKFGGQLALAPWFAQQLRDAVL